MGSRLTSPRAGPFPMMIAGGSICIFVVPRTATFSIPSSMRFIPAFILIAFVTACSGSPEGNVEEQVNRYIAGDDYEQALSLLERSDSTQTEANLRELREKTHLNYGIYLEYRGPEEQSMRERMTSALRQYIAVLRLNPANQKAISEIEQIMKIYGSMPDRGPGEEILSDLRELGFDY